jgi:hypothetical protein
VLPGRNRALVVAGAPLGPEAAHAAPATGVSVTTLAPLRSAVSTPPPWLAGAAAGAGLVLGAAAGLYLRWRARRPAQVHRGRQLLAALSAGELDRAARALAALRPGLEGAEAAAAAGLAAAIDRARFGGVALEAAERDLAIGLGRRP